LCKERIALLYLLFISCVPLLQTFKKSQTSSGVAFLAISIAISGAYLWAKVVHSALTGVGKMLHALSKAASTAADDLLAPRVLSMYPTRYLHKEHWTALTDNSSVLNTFSTASKNEKVEYKKKQTAILYLLFISCVPLWQTFKKSQTSSGVAFLAISIAMSGAYLWAKVVHSVLTGVGKMLQALSNAASTAADDLLAPRVLSMYPTRYLHNEHWTALTDNSSVLNTCWTASEKKKNCVPKK
jgi:predicted DNA-binding protein (MmcQ/YjbR family)